MDSAFAGTQVTDRGSQIFDSGCGPQMVMVQYAQRFVYIKTTDLQCN